jgi:hypothetical protein
MKSGCAGESAATAVQRSGKMINIEKLDLASRLNAQTACRHY